MPRKMRPETQAERTLEHFGNAEAENGLESQQAQGGRARAAGVLAQIGSRSLAFTGAHAPHFKNHLHRPAPAVAETQATKCYRVGRLKPISVEPVWACW